MATSPADEEEEMTVAERRAQMRQEKANELGATHLELSSSWHGNEKFGTWTETVWAVVDYETEDGIHLARATAANTEKFERYRDVREMDREDMWLPKSWVESRTDPEYVVGEPEGESKGEVAVGPMKRTRYGKKRVLLGDTYDAMVEDGLKEEIDWDEAHHTFDGETWVCDRDAVEMVLDVLQANGYTVKVPAGV